MDQNQRLLYLLNQHLQKRITPQEMEEFSELLKQPGNRQWIGNLIEADAIAIDNGVITITNEMTVEKADEVFRTVIEGKEEAPIVKMNQPSRKNWWWAAAAVFLVAAGWGSYTLLVNNAGKTSVASTTPKLQNDVSPGKEGAILTTADGQQIVLDSAANGKITNDVVKNGNRLIYASLRQTGEDLPVKYNTVSTLNGRTYSLVLADGSQVWLNAGSSVTFPTVFVGSERKVEITGEAYFEVTHNPSTPFIVFNKNTGTEVRVLGTNFNVNSYDNEAALKVTLLKGSVRITKEMDTKLLRPGQQAQIANSILVIDDVNMEAVMAWKNGYFHFGNTSLKDLMNQMARWYDVDIVYEGKVPERQFGGEISRQSNLSQVLKILKESKINCRIEGRRLIIE